MICDPVAPAQRTCTLYVYPFHCTCTFLFVPYSRTCSLHPVPSYRTCSERCTSISAPYFQVASSALLINLDIYIYASICTKTESNRSLALGTLGGRVGSSNPIHSSAPSRPSHQLAFWGEFPPKADPKMTRFNDVQRRVFGEDEMLSWTKCTSAGIFRSNMIDRAFFAPPASGREGPKGEA